MERRVLTGETAPGVTKEMPHARSENRGHLEVNTLKINSLNIKFPEWAAYSKLGEKV